MRRGWIRPGAVVVAAVVIALLWPDPPDQGPPTDPGEPAQTRPDTDSADSADLPEAAPRAAPTPSRWTGPKAPRRPFEGEVITLDNGLTVFIVPDHSEPRVAAQIVFRVGSAHDPDDRQGAAHLLEHMIFQGTERLGTLDWAAEAPHLEAIAELYEELNAAETDEEVEAIEQAIGEAHVAADGPGFPDEVRTLQIDLGITGVNAMTTPEYTAYVATMGPELLRPWLTLQAEALRWPVMRGFTNERRVVAEEARLRTGHDVAAEVAQARAHLFGDHPYARYTGGTEESLHRITPDDLMAVHAEHYVASNAALILVGDVSRDTILPMIEETLGAWPVELPPRPTIPQVFQHTGVQRVGNTDPARRFMWSFFWQLRDLRPEDVAVLHAAAWCLRPGRGLSLSSVSLERMQRSGVLSLTAYCGRAKRDCGARLMDAVEALVERGPDDDVLASARVQAEIDVLTSLEAPSRHAAAIAAAFARGEDLDDAAASLQRIRAVTAAEIQEVLGRLVGRHYVVMEAHGALPEAPPTTGKDAEVATDVDRPDRSRFASEVLAIPVPERPLQQLVPGHDFTSWGDGQVVAVWNPRNTLFQFTLRWDVGFAQEPLVCLALRQWRRAARAPEAWGGRLQARGVRFFVRCDADLTSVTLIGLDPEGRVALEQILDRLAHGPVPALNRAPLTHSARFEAYDELLRFGERSRYQTHYPTRAEVAAATAEDLREALDALGSPRIDAFGGDAAADISAWIPLDPPRKRTPRPSLWIPSDTTIHVVLRDRASERPVSVRLFRVGEPSEGQDPVHARIAADIIGYRGQLLAQHLRQGSGRAYAVSGGFTRGTWNQTLARVTARDEEIVLAIEDILDALTDLEALEARWAPTRDAMLTAERTGFISLRGRARAVRRSSRGGVFEDPRPRRIAELEAATWDEFERFWVEETAHPFTIMISGLPSDEVLEELRAMGDVRIWRQEDIQRQ